MSALPHWNALAFWGYCPQKSEITEIRQGERLITILQTLRIFRCVPLSHPDTIPGKKTRLTYTLLSLFTFLSVVSSWDPIHWRLWLFVGSVRVLKVVTIVPETSILCMSLPNHRLVFRIQRSACAVLWLLLTTASTCGKAGLDCLLSASWLWIA